MIPSRRPGVRLILLVLVAAALCGFLPAQSSQAPPGGSNSQSARPKRKQILAWADIRNGFQHDSVSHALLSSTVGYENGSTTLHSPDPAITTVITLMPARHQQDSTISTPYFSLV